MSYLFLSNGKVLDLSFLKLGMKIDSDNEVLKKYDTNSNSIFEEGELAQLKSDILNADINNDDKIDKQEAINLAKILGIAQDKINELFNDNKNELDDALEFLMYEQAKHDSTKQLQHEAEQAYEIYKKGVGGVVAKTYNAVKELMNSKNAQSKVLRQIATKQTAGKILANAQVGISQKEYLEMKIELLEALLGTDSLSKDERQAIESGILKLSVKDLESLIFVLSNVEDGEYEDKKDSVIRDLLLSGTEKPSDLGFSELYSPNSVRAILKKSSAESNLTFEQVYKLETGVEFNADNINEYKRIERDTKYFLILNNKISDIDNALNYLSEKTELMQYANKYGEEQEKVSYLYNQLTIAIVNTLTKCYGNDFQKITETLKQWGFDNVEIVDGKIEFQGFNNSYEIVNLGKKLKDEISLKMSDLKNQFSAISNKNYSLELKNAYERAFGLNNIDIVKAFAEDQQCGVQAIEIGAQVIGVGISIFSGGTLICLSGLALASFGASAIEFAEVTTKEGGITQEEKEVLKKEVAIAVSMIPLGMGISSVSTKCGAMIAKSCPSLVAKSATFGLDAILGLLADYAVTGDVSLTGEGISQLINILAVVVAHKRIQKRSNQIATETEVKPKLSLTQDNNTVFVSPVKNGEGYIIKIGDEEFIANNFDELDNILSQKAKKGDNIDFSDFELSEDICHGARGDEGFWTKIKKAFGYEKTPGQLERKDISQTSHQPKNVDNVLDRIKYVYEKYNFKNYKLSYDDIIENCFAGNVSINHKMFDSEKALFNYISNCLNMMQNNVYYKKYYDVRIGQICKDKPDLKLIQDIAMLKATNPELDAIVSRLCRGFENGILDEFSLMSMVKFLQEGYISPKTIEVCLNADLITMYTNKRHVLISALADSEILSDKKVISARKKIIDTIVRVNPELNPVIKQLKSEIGDDINRIKWEMLDLNSLDSNSLSSFIGDIKNILHLNNIQLYPDNFFIKGFGKDLNWAQQMVDITEQAARMINEGVSSDKVLAFMAEETRRLSLSGKPNPAIANNQGILRCNREGYLCNSGNEERGAITTFEDPKSKYYPYAERFRQRYNVEGGKPLQNPYVGQIELTRLEPKGHYPISPKEYDRLNSKHQKEIDAEGRTAYYVEAESMIHPEGKYVNNALNIVDKLQTELVKKYKGKSLSEADLNTINETIAEIHWVLSHAMPWNRGSAGISQAYVLSIYQSLGLKVHPPKAGISFDLEAFCTELSDYKKNYKYLYEKPAEIVK